MIASIHIQKASCNIRRWLLFNSKIIWSREIFNILFINKGIILIKLKQLRLDIVSLDFKHLIAFCFFWFLTIDCSSYQILRIRCKWSVRSVFPKSHQAITIFSIVSSNKGSMHLFIIGFYELLEPVRIRVIEGEERWEWINIINISIRL